MKKRICNLANEWFGKSFYNFVLILFLGVFILLPIVSNANLLNLNENLLFIENEYSNEDTLKTKNPSFWKKLGFGIGYSGGLCWTGDNLARANTGFGEVSTFYWLNSVEGSIIYPLNEEREIGIGLGYTWWPTLTNRHGLSLYLPNNDPTTGGAYVITPDWNLYALNLSLRIDIRSYFFLGATAYYCKASTSEYLHSDGSTIWPSDTTADVQRWCTGGGVFCGWERSSQTKGYKLKLYSKFQFGLAKEFKNNSPWEWEEKLTIGLTGVFIGIKLEIGGVK